MARRFLILVFILCCAAITLPAADAQKKPKKPLPEGFSLRGIDGKLQKSQGDDEWFFEFNTDANETKVDIVGVTKLNILPCGLIERMIDEANERSMNQFRLWGTATQYKGRNYIFPAYYLPLSKTDMERTVIEDRIQNTEDRRQKTKNIRQKTEDGKLPITNNKSQTKKQTDELGIPTEIITILQQGEDRSRRSTVAEQETGELHIATYAQNHILVDVVGFIRQDKTGFVFVPDALGRNIDKDSFRLLPCRALEQLEREQSAALDPVRFTVAGLVTQYKGDKYLLLQRAIRIYSHGNFTK